MIIRRLKARPLISRIDRLALWTWSVVGVSLQSMETKRLQTSRNGSTLASKGSSLCGCGNDSSVGGLSASFLISSSFSHIVRMAPIGWNICSATIRERRACLRRSILVRKFAYGKMDMCSSGTITCSNASATRLSKSLAPLIHAAGHAPPVSVHPRRGSSCSHGITTQYKRLTIALATVMFFFISLVLSVKLCTFSVFSMVCLQGELYAFATPIRRCMLTSR
mmetsp:Transcript_15966/g.40598  ORF Transcript_15966/g.40598 Transcript_15966/m.40598 type:complete len:222 (-) Transcript_15966:411-1076(-)